MVVHVTTETRIRRLTQTRGMNEKDARARIAAQVDEDELRALADVWLDNSGTPEHLREQVDALWQGLPEIRDDRPGPREEGPGFTMLSCSALASGDGARPRLDPRYSGHDNAWDKERRGSINY